MAAGSSSSSNSAPKTPVVLHSLDMGRSAAVEQERRIMLLLAAGTTVYGLAGWSSLAGVLELSDEDIEDKEDLLQLVVYACRAWFLCTIIIGAIAARGILQKHLPSLRIFALHAVTDTLLTGLTAVAFALVAAYAPGNLGHAVCEHLSRGDALGIVASPGSGLEMCEEKWSYGIAPLLLLVSGIALFIRTKSALFIWAYYREAQGDGRICLESPESSPRQSHEQQQQSQHHRHASTRSRSGRHSRSSSASTVRPHSGQPASRIMLLPTDYDHSLRTPTLNIIPASPLLGSVNSSTESFETIKVAAAQDSLEAHRKRSYSHGSGTDQKERVVVYAPVLMSIDEAQKLGGREAVIASALSSSPTSYASSTTPRHRTNSPPVVAAHGRSSSYLSSGSSATTPTLAGQGGPFSSVKGSRADNSLPSTTEMNEISNHKSL